jgi:hypothetical protein
VMCFRLISCNTRSRSRSRWFKAIRSVSIAPSATYESGHFYFAQTGHSHFAATLQPVWLTLVTRSVKVRAVRSGSRSQAHAFHSAKGKIHAKTVHPSNLSRCVSFALGGLGLRADDPSDPCWNGLATILHSREAGNGFCL